MSQILDFDSLWGYSQPNLTEARFREVLPQIPENTPDYLELLTQIARAQGLQGQFDQAHKTLDWVESRLGADPARVIVRYLLERGRVFNSSGKPDLARPLFEQALELAQQLGEDFYAVDALHMLAIIAPSPAGLDLNLQAIQLAEASQQDRARKWLGSLYNNTGWSYHDLGDYSSAMTMFEKAEAFYKAAGREPERRIATWTVARTLRSLNRIDEALSMQLSLKDEFERIDENDGFVFEEIAECLLALHRAEEAKPYFDQAYHALCKISCTVDQESARLERLKQLSR